MYYWLKAEDYFSLYTLKKVLHAIFTGFGSCFNLNFSDIDLIENLILNFDYL